MCVNNSLEAKYWPNNLKIADGLEKINLKSERYMDETETQHILIHEEDLEVAINSLETKGYRCGDRNYLGNVVYSQYV